ncbi:hypothetical protein [Aquaspirillum serpens]|uniref:hypothetical protein n=1 Tax=Aquaspirillum serpens TaxID=190 RepID=UPI0003B3AEAE|nr:hypothetical protein [Aquaspirillum serpens]
MKIAFYIIGLALLALLVPFFLPSTPPAHTDHPNQNLPWQITVDAQGHSTVFGLTPSRSTLADVRQQLGEDMEIAIVAAPGEVGEVEAYYSQVSLGFVMGRVIFTLDATPATITAMRDRALKAEHMESSTKKISLHPEDLAKANSLPIRAIGLIPSANLDEATVLQRFGAPKERITVGETLTHFLYPNLGLDVVLDTKGKEVLQYVAPKDFETRIRAPLLATQAKPQP